MDVRSSTYVLELYEILVLEDRDECKPVFAIKTDGDNQDVYVSELRAGLTKQKKEALSDIVKLITLIHNIVDYQHIGTVSTICVSNRKEQRTSEIRMYRIHGK